MAIERLSFPQHLNIQAGVEIHPDNMPQQLERIGRRFGRVAQRLREGEYDLTPPIWTKHVYRHTLTVLDSGLGIVRLIPRYSDSQSGMLDHEGVLVYRAGGRLVRVPEDQPIVVVAGPNRLNPKICLYEIVYFTPGPNTS